MERNALEIAVIVHNIIEDVKYWDSPALGLKMFSAFGWWTFAQEHPDMTAEEIASAAADGFAVEV